LGKLFGNTPEFWLHLQRAVDRWGALTAARTTLAQITPLQMA
jgi:antitoxin HigA-1